MDATALVPDRKPADGVLWGFFLLTYFHLLFNAAGYLRFIDITGFVAGVFLACVLLTYCFAYLLIPVAGMPVLKWIVSRESVARAFNALKLKPVWLVYACAAIGSTLVVYLLFIDQTVYGIFGFHLNGFVWNLIWTKGGIESMGAGSSTILTFVLVGIVYLVIEIGLLAAVVYSVRLRNVLLALRLKKVLVVAGILFFVATVFQMFACCISTQLNYSPVMKATDIFPMYVPFKSRPLCKFLGIKADSNRSVRIKTDTSRLKYPLHPIQRSDSAKKYNIVWLVAESLREDMIDKEVMPTTWSFAQRSWWFRNHYSGGNGTRMGMFSMFYGLYGPFWFKFIAEQRGPVLIDELLAGNYQLDFRTSARFTYPEFDQTILASVPREFMHEAANPVGWKSDRAHVTSMLDFIEKRDRSRPFMSFIFFESPHLPYHFPPDTVIRPDYQQDLNYARIDSKTDIRPIKNRYLNSCNHLDTQLKRVLEYLEAKSLLDSTIVLITGDHGEEFMEKGKWGHGSNFSEEQTRPPLIIWAPGSKPQEVTRMSSHLDIPATMMTLLGVTNPSDDYSLGTNLNGGKPREFTVVADWNSINYVDGEFKALMPMQVWGSGMQKVSTRNDVEVKDSSTFYSTRKSGLLQMANDLKRFNQ